MRHSSFASASLLLASALLVPVSSNARAADPIFNGAPDWASIDQQVGTGAALADLDRDGWPDIIVSNGNDIHRQHLTVFYNRGDGTYPTKPDWQSDDIGYHGHLDVADVNGDGYPDVAVSLLLDGKGPAAKLYLNNTGVLSKSADWQSDEKARSFAVAFGDVNNDGRPDLAVATGWPYDRGFEAPTFVHLNIDGALETVASWKSDDKYNYSGALWVDADRDGWLDLLGVGTDNPSYLYRNLGGTLETTASWHTTDIAHPFGIMAAAGDVTGDSIRDLLIADNYQLFNGTGRFRLYPGAADGLFAQKPTWTYFDGYSATLALADVNHDGRLDLLTGAWFDKARLFLNDGDGFANSSTWSSTPDFVPEKIVPGDVNRDGVRSVSECFPAGDAPQRLFYLAHQPFEDLLSITVDGVDLAPSQYTFSRESAWVSIGIDYSDSCCLKYTYSLKPDLVVSNWDESGAFIWLNQLVIRGDVNCDAYVDFADIDAFVLVLSDISQYESEFPNCNPSSADIDSSGKIDFNDIDPFVECLIDGDCP